MIKELITYFTEKVSKEAKAFGHLYEAISLIEKEKRCQSFWLAHRAHCKNFISKYTNNVSNKDKILILGSGPLHEIPIEYLSREFKQVDLVDMVHLKSIKNAYTHLRNIQFIEADITELELEIMKIKKIINHEPQLFLQDQYDLVISANLMSQLPYHLQNYLEKKANPKLSENELDQFGNQVTLDHYNYLNKFSCPVLLITDIETQIFDKNDLLIEHFNPYNHIHLPIPAETWIWNVAPIPEYQKDVALKMKVAAFILNF